MITDDEKEFKTPMMQQYSKIKADYEDCLLLFRMGDFYELFMDDAEIGSKVLDITLTARSKGADGKIPMCGVPFHAINSYLNKLVKAGYKAAICEQVSKPTAGKDIVERKVVRVVTPGTVIEEGVVDQNNNNYALTFYINKSKTKIAISYVDIITGKFYVTEIKTSEENYLKDLNNSLKRITPNEILLTRELYEDHKILGTLENELNLNIYPYLDYNIENSDYKNDILEFFNIKSLDAFNIENNEELQKVSAFLLDYLKYTQKDMIPHIQRIINNSDISYMRIDYETIQNLEIFQSSRNTKLKGMSLEKVINKTSTPMGSRMLKNWLLYPLINKNEINNRLNSVEELANNHSLREILTETVKKINDIERLIARISTKTANPRDLISLKDSLNYSKKVHDSLINTKNNAIFEDSLLNNTEIDELNDVIELIDSHIKEDPPITIREGKMIKEGINEDLDEIQNSIKSSKEWIADLEEKEKAKTGISTLKVGFNSVFGYYIEVSKANSSNVPDNYVRKQTLVNAERYITHELKEKEDIVLNAEEKINEIEYELFMELLNKIIEYVSPIQKIAESISHIDIINGFAHLSIENNYTKPNILDSNHYKIDIKEGRHPVVEENLESGEFSPNSTYMDKNSFVHIITGPNMSGKSTYIRQVAIIQILAQIGCFVPSYKTDIAIADGVYTRIGAGDALAQGLSTFMVEMIETAKILNNATQTSLIILDEVGRGTSTLDGLSIARAVVEYIYKNIKAKTLFATHFHELVELEQRYKNIQNYRIKVVEDNGEIRFLHKVEEGGTDKSYGIEVAKLAGVPKEVTKRAQELLEKNIKDQLKFDL